MSVPMSTINICSGVLLNHAYEHTAHFETLQDQQKYFSGKVVKSFTAYTYLRKSWDIQVRATMEEATGWTYLYFKNTTNGKTYYYFINNVEYINEITVRLYIELDVMQTYMFDYTLARCFIDREHQATDVIGDNILDEGLDMGEYVLDGQTNVPLDDLCVLVLSSINPELTTEETTYFSGGNTYGNVFSGLSLYAVKNTDYSKLVSKLKSLDEWGKSDAILAMWMYPRKLVAVQTEHDWDSPTINATFRNVRNIKNFTYTTNRINTIGEYTPRNKKLLTYPYKFIYVTNNAGSGAVFPYEFFLNPASCVFEVSGSLSPDGACRIHPTNYKGVVANYDEGITLGGFPSCAWSQDVYKLWLAQNQSQQNVAMASGAITIGAGVASTIASGLTLDGAGIANGVMGAVNGATQIAQIMAQRKDMSIQPPQSKGTFSSSVNITNDMQTFTVQKKCVDYYHAAMLDEYFDMYGYKCQRVKIPNRDVRENWCYTKTIGCVAYGNICTDDLVHIQNIYNSGITFWKKPDLIGNYGMSNNPLY